jgi:hypothetical protein
MCRGTCWFSTRIGSVLTHKYQTSLKQVARDQRSSLSCLIVGDKEKSFETLTGEENFIGNFVGELLSQLFYRIELKISDRIQKTTFSL